MPVLLEGAACLVPLRLELLVGLSEQPTLLLPVIGKLYIYSCVAPAVHLAVVDDWVAHYILLLLVDNQRLDLGTEYPVSLALLWNEYCPA